MKVVNYTDLRLNLKHWLDLVVENVEELIITRKNKKDLVLISLDEYNALKETSYLLSGKNRDVLLASMEQAKNGKVKKQEMDKE
jgi:antitoxin YefM